MVAIRNKQHAKPVDVTFYNAWPLPSAGFVPLMQSFCKPENGIRNEFGFLEYPNSTAKEMIEKIEKILKSNWSSTWFSNASSTISPFFQNNIPTENLNQLSAKLIEIMRNNTNSSGDMNNHVYVDALKNSHNRFVPLNKIVKVKKNVTNIENQLSDENTIVDLYELYLYSSGKQLDHTQNSLFDYMAQKTTTSPTPLNDFNTNQQSLDKQTRLNVMHDFFCDKVNFNKVIRSKPSKNINNYNKTSELEQERLCNMTREELNELEDDLVIDLSYHKYFLLNHKTPVMDSSYLSDLKQKITNFIDFQVCSFYFTHLSLN
jgi:hypothetical protein